MESLPTETFLQIISDLSFQDLIALSKTCKRLHNIVVTRIYTHFYVAEPAHLIEWAASHPELVEYPKKLIKGEESFFKYANSVRLIWLNATIETLARSSVGFAPPYHATNIDDFRRRVHSNSATILINYLKPFQFVRSLSLLHFQQLRWTEMHRVLKDILTCMPSLKYLALRSEYWVQGMRDKNVLLSRSWPEDMPEVEDSTVAQLETMRIIIFASGELGDGGFLIDGKEKDMVSYPARFLTMIKVFRKAFSTLKALSIDNSGGRQDYFVQAIKRIDTLLMFPRLRCLGTHMLRSGSVPPFPFSDDCLSNVESLTLLGSDICRIRVKEFIKTIEKLDNLQELRFLGIRLTEKWRHLRRGAWYVKMERIALARPSLNKVIWKVENVFDDGKDVELGFNRDRTLELTTTPKIPNFQQHRSAQTTPFDQSGARHPKIPVKLANFSSPPAFQVITLGAGGGPSEEGVTGFLVRSTATDWAPASILAVDAGSHLASITKILEKTSCGQHPTTPTTPNSSKRRAPSLASLQGSNRDLTINTTTSALPPSHFQGASLPFKTPRANAAHIFRELVGGYCITHPHLDHISGLVINTAGILPHNAKKVIAALPPTIEALKTHIFNDIIWPNLSDENGGVGFLSYQRLVDASVVDGKIEYRKIVDGLSVQAWPVSHGHCMHNHTHRGSDAAIATESNLSREKSVTGGLRAATGLVKRQTWQKKCVYDSSCFFIRDDYTEKEILMFGDVEPDSVSISEPRRNVYIWNYAAEKMHRGNLSAIFIESSYDIHQKDEFLYGHMNPRHIIEELQVLASKVLLHREREVRRYSMPKRRRTERTRESILQIDPFDSAYLHSLSAYNSDNESDVPRSPTDVEGLASPCVRRRSSNGKRKREDDVLEYTSAPTANSSPISIGSSGLVDTSQPLKGLKVVIIHIKDDFDDDKDVRQSILSNLKKLEEKAGLGCTFELAENGGSMFF
ncbi:hypothetical protein ABW20_dc0105182 [Dactylellina cionopaga]|nr:hypothetical protein ABW20_dc0105182 [Dactylellina cionopaga]